MIYREIKKALRLKSQCLVDWLKLSLVVMATCALMLHVQHHPTLNGAGFHLSEDSCHIIEWAFLNDWHYQAFSPELEGFF